MQSSGKLNIKKMHILTNSYSLEICVPVAPEFELNHLKYFYFTVLEGGVESAAQRLCVGQPVVSKMLRSLDDRFQEPLFRKVGRRKVLTDFGQLVYRHCQSLFQEVERLDDLRKGFKTLSGPLTFGISEGVAHKGFSEALKKLTDIHPKVHPNIYTSTSRHLVDEILSRQLEFGLFFHLPALPSALEVRRRIPVRFHLVVLRKFKSDKAIIEKFIGSREIDNTTNHRFPTLERMRRDYKGSHIALSSNHLYFHRELVLSGFGSAVLPDYLVGDLLRKKVLHDLYPKEIFHFDLKIVAPKSQALSPAAQELIQILTDSRRIFDR